MSNMTNKEKFLFIFLQIITLFLIWIYWNKKKKNFSQENQLSVASKLNVDVKNLIVLLGGKENVTNSSATHTKVKIEYKDRDEINVDSIKNLKGISGVFINEYSITIITGNEARIISEEINKLI